MSKTSSRGGVKEYGNICIAITERSLPRAKRAAARAEISEVRLDLCGFSPKEVQSLFSSRRGLIATCRPGAYSGPERTALLCTAIEAGAGFVDVELEAPLSVSSAVIKCARSNNCQVIVSYHNYKETPAASKLEKVIAGCLRKGADIAKVACQINSPRDCIRLLALLDSTRRLIVTGMGPLSPVTRIAAPILGSFVTYASLGKGKESAPGQIELKQLKRLLTVLTVAR